MDIAGVSMALSQAKINNDVGVAVLSKAMDTNESLGDGLVRMLEKADMERSVNPKVGSNIDLYA
ncbi:MAG: YjfB family protein [Lachnospiraceae bacterium]|nr:YjfB family protein [Lachnospiraceae bacterium]MBR5355786.1 YjfB family protein [Lachnospiraceae bacterium]